MVKTLTKPLLIRRRRIAGHLEVLMAYYQHEGTHKIEVIESSVVRPEAHYYLRCSCTWSSPSEVDALRLKPYMYKHQITVAKAYRVVPLILNLMGESL